LDEKRSRRVEARELNAGCMPAEEFVEKERRMRDRNLRLAMLLMLASAILAACGKASSPVTVVEQYLEAIVDMEEVRAVNLSCPEWEVSARAEAGAYALVEVTLEEVTCQEQEMGAEDGIVACSGSIRFSYEGGETEVIELEGRGFYVVLDDGEWKMCGYR
jgi:hypothetical protein